MPHWLHQRCLELAAREAMDYLSPEGQSVVRARLFEEIANTDSQAAERKRQTLGQALADPRIKQVMSAYVQITDEERPVRSTPAPEENEPAGHVLSTGRRSDDDIDTPRSATKPPKPPVAMRRKPSGQRGRTPTDPVADATPHNVPPATATRPSRRNTSKNDDRRTTARTQSADRPDQRAPSRARSNRLKYGDEF